MWKSAVIVAVLVAAGCSTTIGPVSYAVGSHNQRERDRRTQLAVLRADGIDPDTRRRAVEAVVLGGSRDDLVVGLQIDAAVIARGDATWKEVFSEIVAAAADIGIYVAAAREAYDAYKDHRERDDSPDAGDTVVTRQEPGQTVVVVVAPGGVTVTTQK